MKVSNENAEQKVLDKTMNKRIIYALTTSPTEGENDVPKVIGLANQDSTFINPIQAARRKNYFFNKATGKVEKIVHKRNRKTKEQLGYLLSAFEEEPHWSKYTLEKIAERTNLTLT